MLLAGLLASALWGDSLRLQESKVDLTPRESLPLGGYTSRGIEVSQPGGDHLYVRVVLLSQGGKRLALASCEMLTMPDSLYREVKSRLPSDVILFLAATHTHCAPDSQMLNDRMTFSIPGIASYRPRLLDWYADKIAGAVLQATQAPAEPVKRLESAEFIETLNRGRREAAAPDKTATVISADHTPIFFSYAAHPTFFGPERLQFSGDWAGAVAARLGCPVFVGAIGDVSPHEQGKTPQQMIESFTYKMQHGFRAARTRSLGKSTLSTEFEAVRLGGIAAHPLMGNYYKVPQPLASSVVSQFAPRQARITAFRIGKLAVVGVPGEPTSHLGRSIKAYGMSLGFSTVVVISHVNGWMGYILDAADYDRGGYEATLSFYGRDEGVQVVDAADRALRALSRH